MAILDELGAFAESPTARGLAQGLLAASGYQRRPVTFGQALGAGLAQAEQFRQRAAEEDIQERGMQLRERQLEANLANQQQNLALRRQAASRQAEMTARKLEMAAQQQQTQQQLADLLSGQPVPGVTTATPTEGLGAGSIPLSPEAAQQVAAQPTGLLQQQQLTPQERRNRAAGLLMALGDQKTALKVSGLLGDTETSLMRNVNAAVEASGLKPGSKEANAMRAKLLMGNIVQPTEQITTNPDGTISITRGPQAAAGQQQNALQKALAKGDAMSIQVGRDNFKAATDTLNVIANVEKLLPQLPSIVAGPIPSALGLDKLSDVAQKINSQTKRVVLASRAALGGMPGSLSDSDRAFLEQASLSGTSVDKDVLEFQMQKLKEINQKMKNFTIFQENYLKKNGSLLGSTEEWQKRLSRGEQLDKAGITPSHNFWTNVDDTGPDRFRIKALRMTPDQRQKRINELLKKQAQGRK